MKKILIALMCLVLSVGSVSAHGWHGDHRYQPSHGYYHHDNDGRFVRGLIVGSLIGAVVAPRYYEQPQFYYNQPYQQSYSVQRAPVYCIDRYNREYICQYQTVRVYEPED
jgi:hypothetical protein